MKYIKVKYGEKAPIGKDWVNNPLDKEDIDLKEFNIGLLLGPVSGGIVAVDFDGPLAKQFYKDNIGSFDIINNTKSMAWTSGKTGRFQVAFKVPEEHWTTLKTRKIALEDGQGFEMRWAGGQSVIPPSIHPDTNRPYLWTDNHPVADIPRDLLNWWLDKCKIVTPTVQEPADDFEIKRILDALKAKHYKLGFQDWASITWGLAASVGQSEAINWMKQYYPEQKPNEYNHLFKSYKPTSSPTLGTVIFMAGLTENDEMANLKALAEANKEDIKEVEEDIDTINNSITNKDIIDNTNNIDNCIDKLPTILKDTINALEEGAGFPKRMSLVTSLAVISFAAQRLYDVDTNMFGTRPLSNFFVAMQKRSGGKSSLFSLLMKSIDEKKAELRLEYQNKMDAYKMDKIRYDSAKRKWKEGDPDLEEPVQPAHYDAMISAPTTNGIIQHLQMTSNAGLFTTEGAKFLTSYDTRNSDSSTTLITTLSEAWSGEELKKDTGIEKVRLHNRRCNMLLMIQKDMAAKLFTEENEQQGLSSRLLITDESEWFKQKHTQEVVQRHIKMNNTLDKFHQQVKKILDKKEKTSTFDDKELILDVIKIDNTTDWVTWYNELVDRENNNTTKIGAGLLGKLYEHTCRLAGMLAVFDPEPNRIIPVILQRHWDAAIALAEFFYQERLNMITPDDYRKSDVVACAEKFGEWIQVHKSSGQQLTKTEMNNNGPTQYRKMDRDKKEKVRAELVELGIITINDKKFIVA